MLELTSAKTSKIGQKEGEFRNDASAGRGIAVRRGAERVRHTLQLKICGLKKLTPHSKVQIRSMHDLSNPAFLGTKHLDGSSIHREWETGDSYVRVGGS